MNPEQIEAGKDWLRECIGTFINLEDEDIDELTDIEVENAIRRYYDGGIREFINDVM